MLPDTSFSYVERGDFELQTPGWEDEFGRYCWFYIRGYRDAMFAARAASQNPAGINASYLKSYAVKAATNIPSVFRKEAPTLDWEKLAPPQIDAAIHQKAMRFDKAWLAISALDIMCREISPDLNIWHFIRVCPAIFFVGGFERPTLQRLRDEPKKMEELRHSTHQWSDAVFAEMSSGKRTVTYRTARRTAEFLAQNGLGAAFAVGLILSRRGWSPSPSEAVLYVPMSQDGPEKYSAPRRVA